MVRANERSSFVIATFSEPSARCRKSGVTAKTGTEQHAQGKPQTLSIELKTQKTLEYSQVGQSNSWVINIKMEER